MHGKRLACFCSNSTYLHMLENRDKAGESLWQLEHKVDARKALLDGDGGSVC